MNVDLILEIAQWALLIIVIVTQEIVRKCLNSNIEIMRSVNIILGTMLGVIKVKDTGGK